jgi:hypothetical protein
MSVSLSVSLSVVSRNKCRSYYTRKWVRVVDNSTRKWVRVVDRSTRKWVRVVDNSTRKWVRVVDRSTRKWVRVVDNSTRKWVRVVDRSTRRGEEESRGKRGEEESRDKRRGEEESRGKGVSSERNRSWHSLLLPVQCLAWCSSFAHLFLCYLLYLVVQSSSSSDAERMMCPRKDSILSQIILIF